MAALDETESWRRIESARHGVFATLHPRRGPDLVPVVHAVLAERRLAIPVDTVKPKTTTALTRLDNIADDPRATLLIDSYDDDWDRLWWVRASGTAHRGSTVELGEARTALAVKYPQYRVHATVVAVIVFDTETITGWTSA